MPGKGLGSWFGSGSSREQMKVVRHAPLQRWMLLFLAAGVGLAGLAGAYLIGRAQSGLDLRYVDALRDIEQANEARINELNDDLVDASLASTVSHQAAEELRKTIKGLRDEVAGLKEEVTFYKSLMAPSSVARGLHVQEFEIRAGENPGEFAYYLLLTQLEARRNWVQGDVRLEVTGTAADGNDGETAGEALSAAESPEQVLSLTELAPTDTYPLKFRFRYFQDLSGTLTLPEGFEPASVRVSAHRQGTKKAELEQTFDWIVQSE